MIIITTGCSAVTKVKDHLVVLAYVEEHPCVTSSECLVSQCCAIPDTRITKRDVTESNNGRCLDLGMIGQGNV